MNKSAAAPPPVLVLAAPGAGGGTIAAALGRNPSAFDLPCLNIEVEGTLYDVVFEMTGLRSVQSHGILRALGLLLGGEQSMLSVELARRWLMERMHLPTYALSDWFVDRLAPLRMVTPIGTGLFGELSRARIASCYAGADLVMVRRHPSTYSAAMMGQANGAIATLMGASGGPEGQREPDPVGLWMMAEEAMSKLADAMPESRIHSIRIEDVAEDPKGALGTLAKSLGLANKGPARRAMARPEESPFFGPGPYGAHIVGDIEPFDRLVPKPGIPPVALPKAARALGYS